MKAPEKIYINDFGSELSYDWCTEHYYEKDIEYTRTDTFIEKACKWLKSKGGFTIGFDGATVKDFLDYINK